MNELKILNKIKNYSLFIIWSSIISLVFLVAFIVLILTIGLGDYVLFITFISLLSIIEIFYFTIGIIIHISIIILIAKLPSESKNKMIYCIIAVCVLIMPIAYFLSSIILTIICDNDIVNLVKKIKQENKFDNKLIEENY